MRKYGGRESLEKGKGGVWGGKKIHGVGSTPIMAFPTRANPGLCCNRIKKKHGLQYALENL